MLINSLWDNIIAIPSEDKNAVLYLMQLKQQPHTMIYKKLCYR